MNLLQFWLKKRKINKAIKKAELRDKAILSIVLKCGGWDKVDSFFHNECTKVEKELGRLREELRNLKIERLEQAIRTAVSIDDFAP